jgi:predicted transposase/invertase (TIGR01784 family)
LIKKGPKLLRKKRQSKPKLASTDDSDAAAISLSSQQYGIPTYDALFKYVLDKPSIQPSLFHSLAGLDVTTVTRIDEHMNPRQELEHLRKLINDDETIQTVSSLRSKNGLSVSYQGKNGEHVHEGFTKFVEAILPHFDDLRRAFPKPRYDGTMDFVCKLSNGEYAMVEMQAILYDSWDRRALGYVAAFYGKQMREGEKWKDIKRVIGVNILGGGKDSLEHWRKSPEEYMRHYKMQEQLHSPARYINGIEIIHYSLMHTPQSLVDKEKKDWRTFFKEASYMTEEDVRAKISTPAVLEAFERAKLSTLPDRVRELYDEEGSRYAQYSEHTQEQIEKGFKKGFEMGIEMGKKIKKMKSEGNSNNDIKERLSLSDEEFQEYISLIEVK